MYIETYSPKTISKIILSWEKRYWDLNIYEDTEIILPTNIERNGDYLVINLNKKTNKVLIKSTDCLINNKEIYEPTLDTKLLSIMSRDNNWFTF